MNQGRGEKKETTYSVDKVDAAQQTSLVGLGQERHQASADECWNQTCDDGDPALPSAGDNIGRQDGECDTDNSRWHVEKSGLLGCKTEIPDQHRRVGGDNTAGQTDQAGHQAQDPGLRVSESLDK